MNENEIGRKRGVTQIKLMALVLLVFGVGLIVCGVISACLYQYTGQMPLFVGSFILGTVALLESFIYTCIFRKVPHTDDVIKKKEVVCMVESQRIALFALLAGCGMCIGFTVQSGRLSRDEEDTHAAQNQVLAIVILVFGVLMLFVTIYTIYVMVIYGDYLKTSPTKPAPKPKQETSKSKPVPKPKQDTATIKPAPKPKQETHKLTTISSTSNSTEIVNVELQQLKDQNTTLKQQMEEQRESAQRQQQLNQQQQQQLQQQLQELQIQQQQIQQQVQYQSGSLPIPPPPSYMEVDPAPRDKTVP